MTAEEVDGVHMRVRPTGEIPGRGGPGIPQVREDRDVRLGGLVAVLAGEGPAQDGERTPGPVWRGAQLSSDGVKLVEADWLRQAEAAMKPTGGQGQPATTAQDAAGGCDGIKDGKYGFHTGQEANPWWQVDLGAVKRLSRVVIYNRLDYAPGLHNADTLVLLTSDDAKKWTERYDNQGRPFGGVRGADPEAPERLGQYIDGGYYARLDVMGDVAYLGDMRDGIEVLDVSDPTSPHLLARLPGTASPDPETAAPELHGILVDLLVHEGLLIVGLRGEKEDFVSTISPIQPLPK